MTLAPYEPVTSRHALKPGAGALRRCTALWSCFTTCLNVSHLVDDDRRPVRRIGAAPGRRIDLTPIHYSLCMYSLCRHAMAADRLG